MSTLVIYEEGGGPPEQVVTEPESIARSLQAIGVQFERWQARQALSDTAGPDDVLEAYRDPVERLKIQYGLQSADVAALRPDHPDREALRRKFRDEHTHGDFEVRFFVEGRGLFYLHAGGKVYLVLCERGDLLSVPAGTPHWFDMGSAPRFTCIRLFTTPEGWVARFTGSEIARLFPDFDEFVARHV
jgi:1,2-dihydroxy-3-keto-5-methylthiopentene dioxygenase